MMSWMIHGAVIAAAGSWLLADDVEQRLALLLAHDAQRLIERRRQRRRVLDALAPAAARAGDELVVGRGFELAQRHHAGTERPPFRREGLDRALHRVPRAVVEDDEEHR